MIQPKAWIVCWAGAVLLLAGCGDDDHGGVAASLTPTASRRAATVTPTQVATVTSTNVATATSTQVSTATPTRSSTAIPTHSATATSTSSPTLRPTNTSTASPTLTATPDDGLCPPGEILVADNCAAAGAEAGYRADITQAANPFPDDRYRDDQGRLAPPPWSFAEFADPGSLDPGQGMGFINSLLLLIRDNASGWGNFSPIELQLSTAIDESTLPAGMIVLRRDAGSWSVQPHAFTPQWHGPIHVLDLQPTMPLDATATYAVVLTSAVKTSSGAPLGRSGDFRQVLLGAAGDSLQPVLDYADSALGIRRDAVALAFTFTTQATWQDLVTIRDRLDRDELTPTISFADDSATKYQEGIFTDGPVKDQLLRGQASHFRLAAVGTAQLSDFRGTDSVFAPAIVSGATAARIRKVRVEIAIPDLPMPVGGYPVAVLGHGLGGSADFAWDIAEISAQAGMVPPFALLAFDFPNHGARGSGSSVGDTIQYFHLNNFYAMRDSFRETAAEILEIRRLVETAGGAPFDLLDKNQILYAGASLGGINGATFLGVDSRVRTALLSVPAGELVRVLEGEQIGGTIAPLIASLVGLQTTSPAYPDFFRVLVNRGLWIMGAGDPISYAPFIIRDTQLPGATRKAVLIQEGIGDGVLPNQTTEDLARVMGVPIVTAETRCDQPDCRVSGMWQYNLADYGLAGEEPHLVSAKVHEAQVQLLTYLATDGQLITDAHPMPGFAARVPRQANLDWPAFSSALREALAGAITAPEQP